MGAGAEGSQGQKKVIDTAQPCHYAVAVLPPPPDPL